MYSSPLLRFVLLILVAAVLAACGGAPEAPQVAAVSPSAVPPTTTSAPTATPRPTSTTVPTATIEPTATPEPTLTPTPEPTPDVSAFSGQNSYARGSITSRPWMVMIDNHPDAYPQSGMNDAAVVFEGLAEYGITRFIALYEDGITPDVGEIGPIRSTRLYFAQWAMGFHPIYAHAGGSPDGVQLVESTDQLNNFEALRERNYTWRDGRRVAPHNLYTRTDMLRAFAQDKNVATTDDQSSGFLFSDQPVAATIEASTIDYFFLDRGSRAGFHFDPSTNRYYRVMRGQPHVDRNTGQQLWTRNVVVMQVSEAARAGDAKQRIDQEVVGSGPARVFMAGRSVEATWRKEAESSPLRFYDANGEEIVFNVGSIWIAAIPTFDRLTAN